MVKVRPAHAVPACPVPVALGTSTPGSKDPAWQSALKTGEPQLGTSVMSLTWKLSVSKLLSPGPFAEMFLIDNDVGRLSPTVTLDGTVGLTLMPTPAEAIAAPPSSAAVAASK